MLYVGHLGIGQTSLMRAEALQALSVPLVKFDSRKFLDARSLVERTVGRIVYRTPMVDAMNKSLIEAVDTRNPSVVWCDKQEQISHETIEAIKKIGALIVFYTPDPYFAQPWLRTSRSDELLTSADIAVTTKSWEIDQFSQICETVYMPHGYCERAHRRVFIPEQNRVDLGFVGSWEPRRERLLTSAARSGLSVRIWGYGWDHVLTGKAGIRDRYRLRRMSNGESFEVSRNPYLDSSVEARQVLAEEYAEAVSSSKMSPGLLRTTLYPDQHTTRTFEIPACGSMLIAERTAEHESFFDEDHEAVFFNEEEELVEKAGYYAKRPDLQEKIAAAGYHRCISSGYSYTERLRPVIAKVAERLS